MQNDFTFKKYHVQGKFIFSQLAVKNCKFFQLNGVIYLHACTLRKNLNN